MRSLWLIYVLTVIQQTMFAVAHGHHGVPCEMLKKCCKVEQTPVDIKHHKAMAKIIYECHQELGKPESGPGKHEERFVCMTECVMKKQNLFNEDGTFDEEAVKEHVASKIATQDHLKSIAAQTTTKCIEVAKESSGESTCSKIPFKIMQCIMKDFFNACPADLQDQGEECVTFREKINSGQLEASE